MTSRFYKFDVVNDLANAHHRYVFVGEVSKDIAPVLTLLTRPKDVHALSKAETTKMTVTLGDDWECDLGLYEYNKFSSMHPEDEVPDLKASQRALRNLRLKDLTAADRYIENNGNAVPRRVRVAIKQVFQREIIVKLQRLRASSITFIPILIHADDTIRSIKIKLYTSIAAQLGSPGYRVIPPWQYLWNGEKSLSCTGGTVHPNPLKAITDIMKADTKSPQMLAQGAVNDEEDLLLDDYEVKQQDIIQIAILPNILNSVLKQNLSLPQKEALKSLLTRYYPQALQTSVFRLLQNPRHDLYSESQTKFLDSQQIVCAQEQAFTVINREHPSLHARMRKCLVTVSATSDPSKYCLFLLQRTKITAVSNCQI